MARPPHTPPSDVPRSAQAGDPTCADHHCESRPGGRPVGQVETGPAASGDRSTGKAFPPSRIRIRARLQTCRMSCGMRSPSGAAVWGADFQSTSLRTSSAGTVRPIFASRMPSSMAVRVSRLRPSRREPGSRTRICPTSPGLMVVSQVIDLAVVSPVECVVPKRAR